MKYIHKILPIGKQVHRYDPKYPPNCPSCNCALEDIKHFWRCQSFTRLQWRRTFLAELRKTLIRLGTGPLVRELLVSKLRAVLDGDNPDSVPEHPDLEEICRQQELIGWDQLMLGRFAKGWGRHHRTQPSSQDKRAHTWTTDVIDFIYTQWWQLWETRNQDQHGRDIETRHQAEARQVDRELTMFYETYEAITPQHLGWLFDTPIEVRRQWPMRATQQWLNTWTPILHEELSPEAAPTNPENYPYTTALETG